MPGLVFHIIPYLHPPNWVKETLEAVGGWVCLEKGRSQGLAEGHHTASRKVQAPSANPWNHCISQACHRAHSGQPSTPWSTKSVTEKRDMQFPDIWGRNHCSLQLFVPVHLHNIYLCGCVAILMRIKLNSGSKYQI
jgi:hypothetical protein